MVSPIFSSDTNDQTNWSIRLSPQGFGEESRKFIRLFVTLKSSVHHEIRAKFSFSIINSKGKKEKFMTSPKAYRFNKKKDWGFRKFLRRECLLKSENGVLPNDTLTIVCVATLLTTPVTTSGKALFATKSNNNKCELGEELGSILQSAQFSDASLLLNNKEFQVHKVILAARSNVFRAMFTHEMQESNRNRVEITDMEPEILEELLCFIYTRKSNKISQLAAELLIAADKYAMDSLKLACEDELLRTLEEENAADILLTIADTHLASKLKTAVIQ